jgi:preprotein translocase subunit YajC
MSSMSLALSLLLLLQNGSAPAGGGAATTNATGMGMNDIMVLGAAMVGIMYFVVIRPANRERKKQGAMMAALKKGDRILLSCGLVGTVAAMTEREVLVRVDDKNPLRMRFQKHSIQTILSSDDPVPTEVAEADAK